MHWTIRRTSGFGGKILVKRERLIVMKLLYSIPSKDLVYSQMPENDPKRLPVSGRMNKAD